MHWIDWSIVAVLFALMTWGARKTSKYNRSVADFLVAGRCGRRYVLSVAEGIAGLGAITVIGRLESFYKSGLAFGYWMGIFSVIWLVIRMSGFVVTRFRATRALTLAQFLEQRYSRRLRITAGLIMFICGVVNFGIFPAVGARFFIHFCKIPVHFWDINIGDFHYALNLTQGYLMFILIGIAMIFTFWGGQIAVMVTDFIQGTAISIMMCIICVYLYYRFSWTDIITTMAERAPGESFLVPWDSLKLKDFNLWFKLIALFGGIYAMRAWQGTAGYGAAAINPHEARMSGVIAGFKNAQLNNLFIVMGVFLYLFMCHSNFATNSTIVNNVLQSISHDPANKLRSQVTIAAGLGQVLPLGLLGAFAASMLGAFITTHNSYLHSWGSIYVQDVYIPLARRDKPMEEVAHIKLLKKAIFGVAVFIFIFGWFFPIKQYIQMYFALTGTLWMGGAGCLIIGGLYWKRGTTAGAFGAMYFGVILAIVGLWIVQFNDKIIPFVNIQTNGQWIWFMTMCLCIMTYVLVSLFGPDRGVFNMDKLLYKGKYVIDEDNSLVTKVKVTGWRKWVGVNENFTLNDKMIYYALFGWSLLNWAWLLFWVPYSYFAEVTVHGWSIYWRYWYTTNIVQACGATLWFLIGGVIDLKDMFRRLETRVRDDTDDGRVAHEKDDYINKD